MNNEENVIQVKDNTIDISKVKRLTVINCPVYKEYTIFVTDFKEKSVMVDCDSEEDIEQTYNLLDSNLKEHVGKSNNKVYISYENLDLDNQCEVIRVDRVEEVYIQSAKDSLHNRLGYALHIVLENEDEQVFFFETHIDAERYYLEIERKMENLQDSNTLN